MPSLNWIGKDKVINHHNEVPYRVLNKKYTYGDDDAGNMVIHGDNLEALKSLLPKYEGKIRCIYIDPPYNTGNEGWIYNDNVNDPKIKKWIGEVVGKEGDDLSRHDKWLCMIYPRLRLLHRLLSGDGAIFISIDDNELYALKFVCDEIFGANCFVANVAWQRTYSKRNDSKGIPAEVEHILVYSKCCDWMPKRLPRSEEMDSNYKSEDGDVREWSSVTLNAPGAATHQGMVYAIQHPITGELMYPPKGRCWSFGQPQMFAFMSEWAEYEYRDIGDFEKRCDICGHGVNVPKAFNAIMLVSPEMAMTAAQQRYNRGLEKIEPWPMVYFTGKGKGGIRRKQYLDKSAGRIATNLWVHTEVGHTGEAANELAFIFNDRSPFDTPKPERLIHRIVQIASDRDSIILDSFAGSGTTAHAVLNANKLDGGNRHFIMVEMGDYSDAITAERVKRVIDGYGEGSKKVEGTGGGFSFYELGEQLLLDNQNINPDVDDKIIREYIWYMETRTAYEEGKANDNAYYLGLHNDTAYYFYYEKDMQTVLDNDFLKTIKTKADAYVIYADTCNLSDTKMSRYNITFKKIPRDIARL